jgi:DNA recombination protein RmuC
VKPGSAERVEFAIKLPGRDDSGSILYLPIDSKFPQEDYERLLNAQELGEKAGIDDAERKLERAILEQAKIIAKKYIEPPHTTEFAIMYLPTEGLFAEVLRMPGLASKLANELHISVAGPTTLMALLNSLQMGFRTLAIEKRSSEVWKVLSAAKSEFQKYGQVWDKLGKQLQTAQNTVAEAGRRTRVVERKLKSVESDAPGVKTPELIESLLDDVEEIALISGPDAELSALDDLPGVRRGEIEPTLIDLPAEAAKRKDGRTA